jgi:hypothetical protein
VSRFTGVQANARARTHNANRAILTSAASVCVAENSAPAADVTWTSASAGTGVYLRDNYVQTWPTNPVTSGTGSGAYSVTIAATTGAITVTPVDAP